MTAPARQSQIAAAVSFDELLRHNEDEAERWHDFFRNNPDAPNIRVDVAQSEDVRAMLVHIMAVEALYTERIEGTFRQNVSIGDFPSGSVDNIFAIGSGARAAFRDLLARYSERDWNESIEFPTQTSGKLQATRRKMFAHAMFHSMRHWAQLATALRQNGLKQNWQHDFIFTKTMD